MPLAIQHERDLEFRNTVKRCALGGFYCGVGRTGGQLSDEPTGVRRTNEFPSVLLTHQSLSRRKADGNKSFGRSGTRRRPTGREDEHLSGSDERERGHDFVDFETGESRYKLSGFYTTGSLMRSELRNVRTYGDQ